MQRLDILSKSLLNSTSWDYREAYILDDLYGLILDRIDLDTYAELIISHYYSHA